MQITYYQKGNEEFLRLGYLAQIVEGVTEKVDRQSNGPLPQDKSQLYQKTEREYMDNIKLDQCVLGWTNNKCDRKR